MNDMYVDKYKNTVRFFSFLTVAFASLGLVGFSSFIGYTDVYYWFDWSTNEANLTDAISFANVQWAAEIILMGSLALAVLCAICLVITLIYCGRKKDLNGEIVLGWFDRLWSEFHIIILTIAVCMGVLLTAQLSILIVRTDYFNILSLDMKELLAFRDYGGLGFPMETYRNAFTIMHIIGIALCAAIALWCIVALTKKLKAKAFWEKSAVGGLILAVVRGIRKSDKTVAIIICVLLIGMLLSATWFGMIIVIAAIVYFIPKLGQEFEEVRKGVKEVKEGNIYYKIPVNYDKKGNANQLGKLAEDINAISESNQKAVERELKNQRMKSELISNVSHDLKTPLTSMISYVDLLKKEGLDSPNGEEYLRIIDEKTQRLKTLTENLFEAAKVSSGDMPCNLSSIDLEKLVQQSLGELDTELKNYNVIVGTFKDGIEDALVIADGQLLSRVMENLFKNISKYALEGSRVYIDYSKIEDENKKQWLNLSIKNISKEPLNISPDELTERFTRGDSSRSTEGSGLGLAISKDLVNLMGGEFNIVIDGDLFKVNIRLPKQAKHRDTSNDGNTSNDSSASNDSGECK